MCGGRSRREKFPKQKYFDLGAGLLLAAIHTGGKYFGIVDYKNVFIVEIFQDVPEMLVLDLACLAMHDHHATVFSLFRRE